MTRIPEVLLLAVLGTAPFGCNGSATGGDGTGAAGSASDSSAGGTSGGGTAPTGGDTPLESGGTHHSGGLPANGAGGAVPGDDRCTGADRATCEAEQGCAPLLGENIEGKEAYLGCYFTRVGCGGAISCGFNPATGECYRFSSTCIPTGWELDNCECRQWGEPGRFP